MAQEARVTDVWAKYGIAQSREEYELLRQVTHWTSEAVEKEKSLTQREVSPTYVLENYFSDVREFFEYVPFVSRAQMATS